MLFNLDINISKWIYNLRSDAELPQSFAVPGQKGEGLLAAPVMPNFGSQISARSEIDKFEEANYKEVLKKAAEKKLNR